MWAVFPLKRLLRMENVDQMWYAFHEVSEMEFTLNGKRYEVIHFLGKGKGGYSYLVTDGAGRRTHMLKAIR